MKADPLDEPEDELDELLSVMRGAVMRWLRCLSCMTELFDQQVIANSLESDEDSDNANDL